MRNLILLLFISICISCSAQKAAKVSEKSENIMSTSKDQAIPIASWAFTKEKSNAPNEYVITAKLLLAKHWHIFDFEPGGDGLLIAPKFNFDNDQVKLIKKEAVGEIINSQISGMGNVRYYENEVSFKVFIRSNTEAISGSVYYQLCDEQKCMAPTEEPFNLK